MGQTTSMADATSMAHTDTQFIGGIIQKPDAISMAHTNTQFIGGIIQNPDAISMAHTNTQFIGGIIQKLNALEKERQELKNNEQTQKQITYDQAVQQQSLKQ